MQHPLHKNGSMSEEHINSLIALAEPARNEDAYATTLPPALFNDPQWFAAECNRVFHSGWVAVARLTELANPNDFITTRIGGEPCLVVRDRAGGLNALSNICRHRFTTLIDEPSGSAPSLKCPYHLWTYRHDGQLLVAPQMDKAEGFGVDSVCLPRFAVVEWPGWALVNVDSNADPLPDVAPALGEIFEEHRVAEMVSVARTRFPTACNWKIIVNNFAESYHHRGIHPDTLESTYPGFRSFIGSVGHEPWVFLDHVSIVEGRDPFLVLVAFPNLLIAISRNFGMTWFRLEPITAGDSILEIEAFVLPEFADEEGIGDAFIQTLTAINDEDAVINRRTAEGLRSKFSDIGRLSHLEGALARFHRWLLTTMEAQPNSGS